jgi:hypothetical protein
LPASEFLDLLVELHDYRENNSRGTMTEFESYLMRKSQAVETRTKKKGARKWPKRTIQSRSLKSSSGKATS